MRTARPPCTRPPLGDARREDTRGAQERDGSACAEPRGDRDREAGDPQELEIDHYGDTWVVSGAWMERLLGDIRFDDYESRNYFDRQLRKCGLFDRLEALGIADGDTVSIYNWEFTYER